MTHFRRISVRTPIGLMSGTNFGGTVGEGVFLGVSHAPSQ